MVGSWIAMDGGRAAEDHRWIVMCRLLVISAGSMAFGYMELSTVWKVMMQ
jgi:hypothetical protein